MNIIIKTKNLELTEKLRTIINNKIGGLKKFIKKFKNNDNTLFDTFIEVEKESRHHKKGDIFKTEARMILLGKKLVAKAHGENLVRTISEVKDELQEEIKKYKTKTIELSRRQYRKVKNKLKTGL